MLLVAVQFALPNTTSTYALGQFLALLQGWLEIDASVSGWYTQVFDGTTGESKGFNFNWYIVSYSGSYTTEAGSARLLQSAKLLSLQATMNAVVAAKLSDGSLTQAIQERGISSAVGFSDPAALVNAASAVPVSVAVVPSTTPTATASITPSSTPTPSASRTVPPPPAASSSSSDANNTGAIVGGVIGGVAGLVILAALVYYTRSTPAAAGGEAAAAQKPADPYAANSLAALDSPPSATNSVGGSMPYLGGGTLAGVSIRDVQTTLPPSLQTSTPLNVANGSK